MVNENLKENEDINLDNNVLNIDNENEKILSIKINKKREKELNSLEYEYNHNINDGKKVSVNNNELKINNELNIENDKELMNNNETLKDININNNKVNEDLLEKDKETIFF